MLDQYVFLHEGKEVDVRTDVLQLSKNHIVYLMLHSLKIAT